MLDFEILIDDFFINLNNDPALAPIDNKRVLSIINDFADGKWRYKKFQDFVWDNIAETALSFRERKALINKSKSTLTEAAKKLRLTDLTKNQDGQGSELAEIVLYGIMKNYYNALPVVPKIFFKQNSQDNAKGADSVHIIVESPTEFSLWFGEAKFYSSIEDDRLNSIIASVENSLKTDKLEKENSIVTNLADLDECLADNIDLCKHIKELLSSKSSIDSLKPKLHIPILLLHECAITSKQNSLTEQYKEEIIEYHKERAQSYFKKQVEKIADSVWQYSDVHFHIILFPVPAKEPIIKSFVENVVHYKKYE